MLEAVIILLAANVILAIHIQSLKKKLREAEERHSVEHVLAKGWVTRQECVHCDNDDGWVWGEPYGWVACAECNDDMHKPRPRMTNA